MSVHRMIAAFLLSLCAWAASSFVVRADAPLVFGILR